MKKFIVTLVYVLAVAAYPARSEARVWTVDDSGGADFTKIQDAIDASSNGDTILVRPGTYTQNLFFKGRAVTVTSINPNSSTIKQATIIIVASGDSVKFDSGEGSNSIITGFTITGGGINCYNSSPTISKNIIKNCPGKGIYGQAGAKPTISDNRIESNSGAGIYSCNGLISSNIISNNRVTGGSGGGLYNCDGEISGNEIKNNFASSLGGGLYGCDGNIVGNYISGNKTYSAGGGLYNCQGDISHNIISGNVSFEGGGLCWCSGNIYNNTIVGNMACYGGAIKSCNGHVSNNIIAFNKTFCEDGIGGIYGACQNSFNDFWNEGGDFGGPEGDSAARGEGDIINNPLFALDGYWDDKGTPSDPSDDVWFDGDYHVKSEIGRWDGTGRAWVKDTGSYSPCIDAGDPNSDWTEELWPHGQRINLGCYGGTTEASMSRSSVGDAADIDDNGWIDYNDLMLLVGRWLSEEAPLAEDIDRDTMVDFQDFARLCVSWRPRPIPPKPDPMSWATPPYATSGYSIAMAATTATSTDGSGVEYYFEELNPPQHNSGWKSQPTWEDTGLTPNTQYQYRVKARNKGNLLETGWSVVASATTSKMPPTPNPLTWATQPYATSTSSISMTATTATSTDGSGVEYYFEELDHPQNNSGWIGQSKWDNTGLTRNTRYRYWVKARNKGNLLETGWSEVASAMTLGPPLPETMTWATVPYATSTTSISMTATTATSTDGSGVEYYFEEMNPPQHNSGWKSEPIWEDIGLTANTQYQYKVKARNKGNLLETEWSVATSATTPGPPKPEKMTWATLPQATSDSSIAMAATTATSTDGSGVEYYFEGVNPPQHNSGWILQTQWEDTGLNSNTQYGYKVKARNKGNLLETAWSDVAYATTPSVDKTPPNPNPMEWAVGGEPKLINGGGGTWDWYVTMTAKEANDASGTVEYYFECYTDNGFSSPGWLSFEPGEPCTYTVKIGRIIHGLYFHVMARDLYDNETDWSSLKEAKE